MLRERNYSTNRALGPSDIKKHIQPEWNGIIFISPGWPCSTLGWKGLHNSNLRAKTLGSSRGTPQESLDCFDFTRSMDHCLAPPRVVMQVFNTVHALHMSRSYRRLYPLVRPIPRTNQTPTSVQNTPRKLRFRIENKKMGIPMVVQFINVHSRRFSNFWEPIPQAVTPMWPKSPHHNADRYVEITAGSLVEFTKLRPKTAMRRKRFPS